MGCLGPIWLKIRQTYISWSPVRFLAQNYMQSFISWSVVRISLKCVSIIKHNRCIKVMLVNFLLNILFVGKQAIWAEFGPKVCNLISLISHVYHKDYSRCFDMMKLKRHTKVRLVILQKNVLLGQIWSKIMLPYISWLTVRIFWNILSWCNTKFALE